MVYGHLMHLWCTVLFQGLALSLQVQLILVQQPTFTYLLHVLYSVRLRAAYFCELTSLAKPQEFLIASFISHIDHSLTVWRPEWWFCFNTFSFQDSQVANYLAESHTQDGERCNKSQALRQDKANPLLAEKRMTRRWTLICYLRRNVALLLAWNEPAQPVTHFNCVCKADNVHEYLKAGWFVTVVLVNTKGVQPWLLGAKQGSQWEPFEQLLVWPGWGAGLHVSCVRGRIKSLLPSSDRQLRVERVTSLSVNTLRSS